jgi:hypothetical protein
MKPVTLVLKHDGKYHTVIQNCTPEDAERWAREGYHVFQVVAFRGDWAMIHVNSKKVLSSAVVSAAAREQQTAEAEFLKLPNKGEANE